MTKMVEGRGREREKERSREQMGERGGDGGGGRRKKGGREGGGLWAFGIHSEIPKVIVLKCTKI